MMKSMVTHGQDIPWEDLGGGVSRRVLSYTEAIMVVEVRFASGGIGAVHTHPHAQSTYVVSGTFRFSIGDESHTVRTGDTIAFESGVRHGTECLEAGTLLDVFAPMREDFLPRENA